MKKVAKHTIGTAVVLTLAVSTAGLAAKKSLAPTKDMQRLNKLVKSKKSTNLLFIESAKRGSLKPIAGQPACFTLTLYNPGPGVLYFSDQPQRITGRLETDTFVNLIKNNRTHYKIKPNVAIHAYSKGWFKQTEVNYVMTLSNPKYIAKRGREKKVTYTVCALPKHQLSPVKKLNHITIFFDQFRPWPP